jgi:hypothetical protein
VTMRPLTGLALYALSGLAGWFIAPVVGLISIILVLIHHAVTSEGLHEGPLGGLFRRRAKR